MNASPFLPAASTSKAPVTLFPSASQTLDPSLADLSNWQLAFARLKPIDPECEFYTLRDIAPVLGSVNSVQLSDHAHDLWPGYEGNYRLNPDKAIKLIKRYLLVGRKKFTRAQLEALYLEMRAAKPQSKPIFN